jgi:two-component system chemotaxis response regulator CheY
MRALIVDDSPRVRSELRQLLGRLGWNIVGEAVNGVEALEMAEELKPDLVTLDIIMPEMDGIECYRELRKLSQPPRCLLISVLAAESRVVAALPATFGIAGWP